jgi:signal transduction histidine kinase
MEMRFKHIHAAVALMTCLRRRILLLLTLLLSPSWVFADFITERAMLEDPSGQLTFEEVRSLSFRDFDSLLSLGYGGVVWVRLRIDPNINPGANRLSIYLRARPVYLDELLVYDPLQGAAARPALGDRYSMSAQDEPSASSLIWRLPIGEGPREIWVRMNTDSTRLAYFEVLDENSLRLSEARLGLLGGLYLAIMSMFVLWGLFQFSLWNDGLIRSFVIYISLAVVSGAGMLGYTRFLAPSSLPAHWIDISTSMMLVAACWAAVGFSRCLLDELVLAKRWRWLISALTLVFPVLLLLITVGCKREALQLNMLLILMVSPLLLLVALQGSPQTKESASSCFFSKRTVVAYFGITMILGILTALPALGFMQGQLFSLYIVMFYSFCTCVLMAITVNFRNNQLQLLYLRVDSEATHERRERESREQLLDMLGHELKTPMATVRMLAGDRQIPKELGGKIATTMRDMSLMLDRVLQAGQIDNEALTVRIEQVNLIDLLS